MAAVDLAGSAVVADGSAREIDGEHPAFGAHLRASVSTGSFCAYRPTTDVRWRIVDG